MKMKAVIFTMVLVSLSVSVCAGQDILGFPTKAEAAETIQIPFDMKMASKAGEPRKLDGGGGVVHFKPSGSGESLDLGNVKFSEPGNYHVYVKCGVGWSAKHRPGGGTFFLEMDGHPVAVFDPKGTGGAGKMQWFNIGSILITKPSSHKLIWKSKLSAKRPRKAQYMFAGLALVKQQDKKAAASKEKLVRISSGGWIRSWLLGGPFGYSGVTCIAPHYQQYMLPLSGVEWKKVQSLDSRLRVRWREYVSPMDEISLDLPETFAGRPGFAWPVGQPGCAYGHLYVKFPSQNDVLLDFESSVKAELFFNGEPITPGKSITMGVDSHGGFERKKDDPRWRTPITIPAGVNRFMVKLYFPQSKYRSDKKPPTWFKFRLLGMEGKPVTITSVGSTYAQANVTGKRAYLIDPPNRYCNADALRNVKGRRLGDLVKLQFDDRKNPAHIFITGKQVKLDGAVSLMKPLERLKQHGVNDWSFDKDSHRVRVNWIAYDFDGSVAGRGDENVEFSLAAAGKFSVDLGKLPRGHYTIYCQILKGLSLLSQPWPTMVTVTDPTSPPAKGVHSKFAHSGYYVLQGKDAQSDERNIRILTLAKVRMSVGSVADWWMHGHPKKWLELPADKRTWPRAPRIESILKARKLGLEFIGQIGAYSSPARRKPRFKHLGGNHLILNHHYDCGPIDSPETAKLIDTYVYETVKKFKKHFRYWRLSNELNLHGFTPEEYVYLHTIAARALKRADPKAKLWSGSISGISPNYMDNIFRLGIDRHVDVLDYHQYIWPFSDSSYRGMGGIGTLTAILDKYKVRDSLLLADGEFGCYQSIFPDGARTQAAMFTRALTVAHTYDRLGWIAPHMFTSDRPGWWITGAGKRGQYPAYLAYRTAADFLEGATPDGELKLPGIVTYKFKCPSRKVVVMWDVNNKTAKLPHEYENWQAYDLLGRPVHMQVKGELKLSIFPIYLTNKPLN